MKLQLVKTCGSCSGVQAQQVRCMVGLMRWLQLYILSDPAAAQPDVAADLQGVFNGAFTKTKPAAGVCPAVISHLVKSFSRESFSVSVLNRPFSHWNYFSWTCPCTELQKPALRAGRVA